MRNLFSPKLIIVVGALLFLASAGYWAYTEVLPRPKPISVPEAVAGVQVTQKISGADAVTEVTLVHGKEFPMTSGVIAIYGDSAATVWVSSSAQNTIAAQMVQAMTNKIAEGRSPFTSPQARQLNGRRVYELSGMGQQHFYFQSGKLVIWLTADKAIAEKALGEITAFYP
ncbi:MAG: hypothetical protein AAB571_12330 [Chloroflexota bacterium]